MNTFIMLANGNMWALNTNTKRWLPVNTLLLQKLITGKGI